MRLSLISILSAALLSQLTGCSNTMPNVGEAMPAAYNGQMPVNASSPYPSADGPMNVPVAPAFNPPKFYRT